MAHGTKNVYVEFSEASVIEFKVNNKIIDLVYSYNYNAFIAEANEIVETNKQHMATLFLYGGNAAQFYYDRSKDKFIFEYTFDNEEEVIEFSQEQAKVFVDSE